MENDSSWLCSCILVDICTGCCEKVLYDLGSSPDLPVDLKSQSSYFLVKLSNERWSVELLRCIEFKKRLIWRNGTGLMVYFRFFTLSQDVSTSWLKRIFLRAVHSSQSVCFRWSSAHWLRASFLRGLVRPLTFCGSLFFRIFYILSKTGTLATPTADRFYFFRICHRSIQNWHFS